MYNSYIYLLILLLATSPPENLRDKLRPRAFEEVFPGVKMPIDYAPLDEDDEIELIDDEALVRSPKRRDLIKRYTIDLYHTLLHNFK